MSELVKKVVSAWGVSGETPTILTPAERSFFCNSTSSGKLAMHESHHVSQNRITWMLVLSRVISTSSPLTQLVTCKGGAFSPTSAAGQLTNGASARTVTKVHRAACRMHRDEKNRVVDMRVQEVSCTF